MVSPLGPTVLRSWNALIQGHSGVKNILSHCSKDDRVGFEQVPCQIAGLIPSGSLPVSSVLSAAVRNSSEIIPVAFCCINLSHRNSIII
jgi:hypothetical protein